MNLLLIFLSAMLIPGSIIRTKSRMSGRKGPGMWQPQRDVWVLLRKGNVISPTAGLIFRIAPMIALATLLISILLLPVGSHTAALGFAGDFVFFAYLLALGRFFMILAAMDTGSGFSGMGANREALYAMLAEPAFFLLMGTLVMTSGEMSFSTIFSAFSTDNVYFYLTGITGLYLLSQLAMIENSRLPVDDPKTHLELTMVHEVMILDYSGFDLAIIHISTWLKFAVFGNLIANCILPSGWSPWLFIPSYLGVQFLFGIMIGFLESFRARNKMMQNPKFILTLTAIAATSFAVLLILMKTSS